MKARYLTPLLALVLLSGAAVLVGQSRDWRRDSSGGRDSRDWRDSRGSSRDARSPSGAPEAAPATAPAFAPAAPSETSTVPRPSYDHYSILTERNIFLRDRSRPRSYGPPSSGSMFPPPPPPPGRDLVLRGTILLGGDRVAFLEHARDGSTQRARAGESVGGGRLTAVGIDYVLFDSRGRTARIPIGTGLDGSLAATPSYLSTPPSAGSSASATTAPATQPDGALAAAPAGAPPAASGASPAGAAPSSTPLPPGSDLLERMRRRAMEERNR